MIKLKENEDIYKLSSITSLFNFVKRQFNNYQNFMILSLNNNNFHRGIAKTYYIFLSYGHRQYIKEYTKGFRNRHYSVYSLQRSLADLQKVHRANLRLEQGIFSLLFAQYISTKLACVVLPRLRPFFGASSLQCYNSS